MDVVFSETPELITSKILQRYTKVYQHHKSLNPLHVRCVQHHLMSQILFLTLRFEH